MLLLVVSLPELNSTLLTMDILVHLKPLSITRLIHTDLIGKETSTSHRVSAAICVALSSEVTLPHRMAAHRKVGIKKQLAAEGWPQSLEKVGMQLSLKWPPPEGLPPRMFTLNSPSKQECFHIKYFVIYLLS